MFASQTDTFGQVILEAQASGLPVLAVAEGGPKSLIEHGETGLLVAGEADALADAVVGLVQRPVLRERLIHAALNAVRTKTWEDSLERLAVGYRLALSTSRAAFDRRVA